MKRFFIYIMSNKPKGTIYIGVTSDLLGRVYKHKHGSLDGFTRKYGLKKLVYYEAFYDWHTAMQREKNLKHWLRAWKLDLIEGQNPTWSDLWEQLSG